MKFKLTDMGKVMEAQLLAGSKPIITKIEASDAYSSNEGALLSVQNKKQELEIQEIAVIEGASHLKFVLHNVGLAEEYMLRQIGIYAKQDEQAEEILYIIGQDKAGERVPASTEKHVDYEYDLVLHTDNAYEVQVVVKPSFFATKEELNETNEKVNGLLTPEFDDSGSVAGIRSFPDFLKTMVSRSSIFQFMRNAKAGFQFVLHTGALVNNCTSTASNLPLAAAQGKVLMDMITKLNSEFQMFGQAQRFAAGYDDDNNIAYSTYYSQGGRNKQINVRNDGIWCYTFEDGVSKKLWETALKSDLGSTRGMKLLYSYIEDIDNPPLAMILQAATNETKGTLPTGIGGTIFTIIQSNPTIAYKQYNSQLALGFGSDKIAFRRRSGGDWSAWKYLAFS